jgi:DNA transformation protein and related proteins
MAVTEGFKDLVRDLLADFGPVTIRNMFGGAGIYAGGVMFAILDDDVLYLKTDETSARAFRQEGMEPFTYVMEGKGPVAMSYFEVPPRLLEAPEELVAWTHEAIVSLAQTRRSDRASGGDLEFQKPEGVPRWLTGRRARD